MKKKLMAIACLLTVAFIWFVSTLTAGSENYWIIVPLMALAVALALVVDSLMSGND